MTSELWKRLRASAERVSPRGEYKVGIQEESVKPATREGPARFLPRGQELPRLQRRCSALLGEVGAQTPLCVPGGIAATHGTSVPAAVGVGGNPELRSPGPGTVSREDAPLRPAPPRGGPAPARRSPAGPVPAAAAQVSAGGGGAPSRGSSRGWWGGSRGVVRVRGRCPQPAHDRAGNRAGEQGGGTGRGKPPLLGWVSGAREAAGPHTGPAPGAGGSSAAGAAGKVGVAVAGAVRERRLFSHRSGDAATA